MGHLIKCIETFLTDGVGDADRQGAAVFAVTKGVQGVCSLSRLRYEETDVVPGEQNERNENSEGSKWFCRMTLGKEAPKLLLSQMFLLAS